MVIASLSLIISYYQTIIRCYPGQRPRLQNEVTMVKAKMSIMTLLVSNPSQTIYTKKRMPQ